MAKILTDRAVRAAKAAAPGKRRLMLDSIVPGYGARISDKGQKSLVLVTRFGDSKNPTPRKLGDFGVIGVKQGRDKARSWLELIARGIDPATHEAQERAAELAKQENTFAAVFESYFALHLSRPEMRSGKRVERDLRGTLMKPWAARPISTISKKDVQAIVNAIHDSGKRRTARLRRVQIGGFFNWCVRRGLLDVNPAALVERPSKERSRDRVLSDAEIAACWRAAGNLGPTGRVIRFILCTGQRRGECGGVPWSEIDLGARLWGLPAERTKNKKPHTVPLSDLAIECLGDPGGGFVFSNNGGSRPITSWSKATARLRELVTKELPGVVADWTLHDLRRTATTGMARLKIAPHVVDRILNHTSGTVSGVAAVYNRFEYLEERRAALDAWARYLERVVNGGKAGKVIELRGQRP
jgi:integrase